MFEIRPFRNSDPPGIASVWRSQPPHRGLTRPVTAGVLELCVFSKQVFDPEGMLVAERGGEVVGFAHAGFGPDERGEAIDTTLGTTHLLMLRADAQDDALADELIARSEAYQKSRGATVHYAGGIRPLDAFYLGLYGGSELPGVLESDPLQMAHFVRNDYTEAARVVVMQRELTRYRFGGPRETRQIKRDTSVEQTVLPPPRHWWEACVTSGQDRLRFGLRERRTGAEIAHVLFWDIEPLATSWGIPTVGMVDLWVDPSHRRKKAATHLLNESLRLMQRRGAAMVEAQTMAENKAALALYEEIGFTPIDEGRVLRRGPSTG
ncbi:GNAT family N-acetyltransferase [Botrimarina sp.]|uniref:GNAT family N-acetyltransferase n=1 Tax=Botrimarina sp. TaxID=2795802 RepID=UPI0032EF19B2